jgi:CO dehydrogenase maturation factor
VPLTTTWYHQVRCERGTNDPRGCNFRRAAEKGRPLPFERLEPTTFQALEALLIEADLAPRDWEKLYHQAVGFHLRNARRWANAAAGEDLTGQVDPDFMLHPDLQPS